MRIENTFINSIHNNNNLRERVNAHMQRRGFKQMEDKIISSFSRGSARGSFNSFSPEDWHCKVTIDFAPNEERKVFATFDIDTKWQIVLPWEKAFWNSEIKDLEAIINSKTENIGATKALRKAVLLNLAVLPLALIVVVSAVTIVLFLPALGIGVISQKLFHVSESNSVLIGLGAWWVLLITVSYIWFRKRPRQKGKK